MFSSYLGKYSDISKIKKNIPHSKSNSFKI